MFDGIELEKLSVVELQDLAGTNSPNMYIICHRPMKKIVYRLNMFKINFKKKFKESNFKKKFEEYKEKPKSKRKSFTLGFTTAVGIFSLIFFGPVLSAAAKDIPTGNLKPTDIAPAPSGPPSKEIINTGLSGVAGSVCALAITSGSFAIGIACGCIVVVAILHAQGK